MIVQAEVRDYLQRIGLDPDSVVELVGPKGYVHGWKYVGTAAHGGSIASKVANPMLMRHNHTSPITDRAELIRHLTLQHGQNGTSAQRYINMADTSALMRNHEFYHVHPEGVRATANPESKSLDTSRFMAGMTGSAVPLPAHVHGPAAPARKGTGMTGRTRVRSLSMVRGETVYVVELVGPKGYVHGWKYVGPVGGEREALLSHIVKDHSLPRKAALKQMTGTSLDELKRVHEGLGAAQHRSRTLTHSHGPVKRLPGETTGAFHGRLAREGVTAEGRKAVRNKGFTPAQKLPGETTLQHHNRLAAQGGGPVQRAAVRDKGFKPRQQKPLRIAGQRMSKSQENDFNSLSESGKDAYEEQRQEGVDHADALASARRQFGNKGQVSGPHGPATVGGKSYAKPQETALEESKRHESEAGKLPAGAKISPLNGGKLRAKRPDGSTGIFDTYAAAGAFTRGESKRTVGGAQVQGRSPSVSHADLLGARKAARAKYPVGHPERLKAERAVRQSRKARGRTGTTTKGPK